jgi:UDP-N-acetyl-D-glucosamine dehydrogenase
VGIVGLGYVGLPLALLFARNGFAVAGFDLDPSKVTMLECGESHIRHISETVIAEHIHKKRFQATTVFSHLREEVRSRFTFSWQYVAPGSGQIACAPSFLH